MLYDRILLGQVIGVDKDNYRCKVRLVESPEIIDIELTFPFISLSSGIRFLPNVGDVVLVGWTPNLVPKIIGFSVLEGYFEKVKKVDTIWFRDIEPGDIVIYSGQGESELYLSSKRFAQLSSGVNTLRLDAVRQAVNVMSSLVRFITLSGVDFKFGKVVREVGSEEISIPGVEFSVGIEKTTGKIVELKLGDVVDDRGIIEANKSFSLKALLGDTVVGEIYLEKDGVVNLSSQSLIKLGGLMAVSPAIKGDILVTDLDSILSNIITVLDAFKVKDGMDVVVQTVKTQLNLVKGQLQNILSSKVFLE